MCVAGVEETPPAAAHLTTTIPYHLLPLLSPPVMAEAPRRTDGLSSRELNEPPQSSGLFDGMPNIPKVAGDYQAAYVQAPLLSQVCLF